MSSKISTSDAAAKAGQPKLLSVIELGGYPDFSPLYRRLGFDVISADTSRKAITAVKKQSPAVVVAEFNYQSDFRDRTSSLESLLASLERFADTRAIVFYEQESFEKLERLLAQFDVFKVMAFPIDEAELEAALVEILEHD
jgi:DNA-binding NtrC family response regulator